MDVLVLITVHIMRFCSYICAPKNGKVKAAFFRGDRNRNTGHSGRNRCAGRPEKTRRESVSPGYRLPVCISIIGQQWVDVPNTGPAENGEPLCQAAERAVIPMDAAFSHLPWLKTLRIGATAAAVANCPGTTARNASAVRENHGIRGTATAGRYRYSPPLESFGQRGCVAYAADGQRCVGSFESSPR